MTQSQAIVRYLRSVYPTWKKSHELMSRELVWLEDGQELREWVGSEGKKRCRELRAAGLIEEGQDGKYATFRAKPPTVFETGYDPTTGEVLYRRAVYS